MENWKLLCFFNHCSIHIYYIFHVCCVVVQFIYSTINLKNILPCWLVSTSELLDSFMYMKCWHPICWKNFIALLFLFLFFSLFLWICSLKLMKLLFQKFMNIEYLDDLFTLYMLHIRCTVLLLLRFFNHI